MKEMDDLSSGIQRLKRNSESQKRVIEQLEKDRAFLMERTRFLSQKLSEAYVIYEEAGKRILDFVDKETAPIKNQIGELKDEVKKLSEMEQPLKSHSAYLEKMKALEQDLKARVAESEKSIRKLNETTAGLRSYIERVRETEGKEEEAIGTHVAEIRGHLEARIKTVEEKLTARIAAASEEVLQDSNDSITALYTSHEVLRKRISDGELAIKQLRFGTATLKKHMENAGIARQEIEKKAAVQNALIKEAESAIGKMRRRLDGISLEDDRLEKRLSELRKSSDADITSRAANLKAMMESGHKREMEILNAKTAQMKMHIDSQHSRQNASLDNRLVAFASEFQQRINALGQRVSARDHAIENEIIRLRKQAKLEDGALADRMERQAILLEKKLKRQQKLSGLEKAKLQKSLSGHMSSISEIQSSIGKITKRLDGISLEDDRLEKRLSQLRKATQDEISAKSDALMSQMDISHKKQLELLDSKVRSLSSDFHSRMAGLNDRLLAENERVNAGLRQLAERFAKKMESEQEQDLRFEKHLGHSLKVFEGTMDAKMHKLRAEIGLEGKNHLKAIDGRLASMAERFDGRLESDVSKLTKRLDGISLEDDALERRISDAKRHAETLVESSSRKNIISLESRLKEIEGELDRKFSSLGEKVASEKLRLKDVKSYIAKKIDDSQKISASRLSGLDSDFGKKLSQVYSHVASERKSIGDLRLTLEKEMMDAQKSLTSRVAGLADTTEAKLSRLSESVSSERKALAEERAKFSGKLADTNHSLARLAESVKSMDSRIMESKADESEKGQKLRLLESAFRSLSADVSSLKKGMQAGTSFDAAYKKRMIELEASVKRVASSVSGLESGLKAVSMEAKRKGDSAASSDAGLDKELEKSKETIRHLIEASRTSHEMSRKRIESLESAVRMLSEKLSRNGKAVEDHMADMKEKLTKAEETRVKVKESEMKEYFEKTLKERYESEVSRMRSEMARLVKEITEWKEEQAKLYELLKEE